MRVLVLPSGGTVEIPMPNSKRKGIAIRPPSPMLRGAMGTSYTPVVIGLLVGVAIGGGVVWWLSRRQVPA